MSVLAFLGFLRDMSMASVYFAQEKYFEMAMTHCERSGHPDAWLVARRYANCKSKVNDLLRRHFA